MRRTLSVVAFCALAFAATLALQSVWSALVVVNLQTSPALPWSVVAMAIALWSSWEYAGARWAAGIRLAGAGVVLRGRHHLRCSRFARRQHRARHRRPRNRSVDLLHARLAGRRISCHGRARTG